MALQLLDELRQAPISYRPQLRPRDARGRSEYRWGRGFLIDWLETLIETCFYMLTVRCFPVMPAELAWLFATRPVFMYPELLPCASLDPALYCPRRTAAFTPAEDWWAHTHCNTKRPEKNLHHALSVCVCVFQSVGARPQEYGRVMWPTQTGVPVPAEEISGSGSTKDPAVLPARFSWQRCQGNADIHTHTWCVPIHGLHPSKHLAFWKRKLCMFFN